MADSPPEDRPDLDRLAEAPRPGLIAEVFDFLAHNKKWWLLPILVMLGLFGALAALATSGIAPFIYTLF